MKKKATTAIKNLAKNKIVIFSSHLLNEINEICNKVIFLDKGNIVLKSNIKELKNRYNNISLDKIFNFTKYLADYTSRTFYGFTSKEKINIEIKPEHYDKILITAR